MKMPTDQKEESPPKQSQPEVLLSMEGLIKNHLQAIETLTDEVKKQKEMLDDIFANDPTYQEHLNMATDATKTKNATKSQVLKQPQAADLDKKIKDIKVEIKENKGSLSDYLAEYSRLSGLTEIEDHNGKMQKITANFQLRLF